MSMKRFAALLAGVATLTCLLSLAILAAPPAGKGKPKDEEPPPPPLPADLDVRYRVHYIPLPEHEGFWHEDLNEVFESVGGWDNPGKTVRTGFYYNAATKPTPTYLNATDMFTLPEGWVSTHFTGINNLGTIVGFATDDEDKQKGIIVRPANEGFTFEFLPSPVDPDGLPVDGFRAWAINDVEDVIGVYWVSNPDGSRTTFGFAYNSGRLNTETKDYSLPMTPLGFSTGNSGYEVFNDRRGFIWSRDLDQFLWYDFAAAQTLHDEDPNNDTEPLSLVWMEEGYKIAYGGKYGISNDGQLPVYIRREVSRRGQRVTYASTPGVIQDEKFVWNGDLDEGKVRSVNSKSGANKHGDILGSGGGRDWILHADHLDEWGRVDLRSMLVFDTADDEQFWDLERDLGPFLFYVSDRDPVTGFGVMIGQTGYSVADLPVVLMPEVMDN